MRLDKFLSDGTGLSRREVSRAIRTGEVTIDGVVERKAAMHVPDGARVYWGDIPVQVMGPTYLLMNKPDGAVCANDDPMHPTVFVYLDVANPSKLHTVGRLDRDTTGLLLITTDGQWSHRITSPKYDVSKVYRAWLAEPLRQDAEQLLEQGIQLHGEKELTRPAQLERVADTEVLLTIHEGKYHQVKRMFAALDNKVVQLHREQIGALVLDSELEPGEYRELTEAEIALF